MTILERIKRIARKKNIEFEDIIDSPVEGKRYRVIFKDKRPIDFGAKGFSTYLEHKDKERRRLWHSRFKNNVGYNNPDSGLYFSARILWPL